MKSSAGIKSTADTNVLIAASGQTTDNCTLVNTSSFAAKWWIGDDDTNYVELPANTSMSFLLKLYNANIHFAPKSGGDTITAWGFVS